MQVPRSEDHTVWRTYQKKRLFYGTDFSRVDIFNN